MEHQPEPCSQEIEEWQQRTRETQAEQRSTTPIARTAALAHQHKHWCPDLQRIHPHASPSPSVDPLAAAASMGSANDFELRFSIGDGNDGGMQDEEEKETEEEPPQPQQQTPRHPTRRQEGANEKAEAEAGAEEEEEEEEEEGALGSTQGCAASGLKKLPYATGHQMDDEDEEEASTSAIRPSRGSTDGSQQTAGRCGE